MALVQNTIKTSIFKYPLLLAQTQLDCPGATEWSFDGTSLIAVLPDDPPIADLPAVNWETVKTPRKFTSWESIVDTMNAAGASLPTDLSFYHGMSVFNDGTHLIFDVRDREDVP